MSWPEIDNEIFSLDFTFVKELIREIIDESMDLSILICTYVRWFIFILSFAQKMIRIVFTKISLIFRLIYCY